MSDFFSSHTGTEVDNAVDLVNTMNTVTALLKAGNLAGLADVAASRTNLGLGTSAVLDAGSAGGVATLDGGGKVPTSQLPAAVLGAVDYQGVWNANTNTPTLVSSTGTKGWYYKVSVQGTTTIDGISEWNVNDWIIFNGTTWDKVDNSEEDATTILKGRIQLAGDLGGTAASPSVLKINGSAVGSQSPTQNQRLIWNAGTSEYEPATFAELQPCKAVATANVSSLSGTTTIDSIALAAGDRLLLTAQSTASQNGPWTIQSGAWTRPISYTTGQAVSPSAWVAIVAGTVYANTFWQMTGSTSAITVDTTSTAWTQLFPQATTGVTGLIKLAQDLGGTALLPVVKQASQDFSLTSIISPTSFSSSQNDYNPTGLATASIIRLSPNPAGGLGSNLNLTGIAAPSTARVILLVNIGTKSKASITLTANDSGSSAANRFGINNPVMIQPNGGSVMIWYDTTSSLWRVHGTPEASSLSLQGTIQLNGGDIAGTATAPVVNQITNNLNLATVNSPTALASDTNDWAIGGTSVLNLISSSAAVNVTGMVNPVGSGNQVMILVNTGSNNITFKNLSGSSSAAHQFSMGADFTLLPSRLVIFVYDNTNTKWRCGNSFLQLGGGTVTGLLTASGGLTASGTLLLNGIIKNTLTSLSFSSTTNVDWSAGCAFTLTVTGTLTITDSNITVGQMVKLILTADSGGPYTLTFPGWTVLGAALPANIPASKTIVVSLEATGTTDGSVLATTASQI